MKNVWIWLPCVIALALGTTVCWAQSVAPKELAARGGLPNIFGKLQRGEDLRIAYLGGSITDAQGWRPMTHQWFQETYPQVSVLAHNAAHSGTTSDLACFRLKRDCLSFAPDLLFIEFGVNDGIATKERIYKGMEGIIRQARRANPKMDICIVYTLSESMVAGIQEGKFPHTYEAMEVIADHYNLPSVHMGLEVVQRVKEGLILFRGPYPTTKAEKAELGDRVLFSCDGVHPLKEGHALYRDAVARAMETMASMGVPGPAPLPDPFREDNFEDAQPSSLSRVSLSGGWQKLDPATHPLAKRFQKKLPELYYADMPGASITVRFKGTSILLYDLVGPDCGQIIVTVDNKQLDTIPRFDAWTQDYRVHYFIGATDLENTEHVARFEIHAEQPNKAEILGQRGKVIDNPNHYDGTAWYVGDVLVTGEIFPANGLAAP
jgi:lysophospholipase L1-like esterase